MKKKKNNIGKENRVSLSDKDREYSLLLAAGGLYGAASLVKNIRKGNARRRNEDLSHRIKSVTNATDFLIKNKHEKPKSLVNKFVENKSQDNYSEGRVIEFLKNKRSVPKEKSTNIEDHYSMGGTSAGSPGGGSIGAMGGNTNKGLYKLPEGYHEKAKANTLMSLMNSSYSEAENTNHSFLLTAGIGAAYGVAVVGTGILVAAAYHAIARLRKAIKKKESFNHHYNIARTKVNAIKLKAEKEKSKVKADKIMVKYYAALDSLEKVAKNKDSNHLEMSEKNYSLILGSAVASYGTGKAYQYVHNRNRSKRIAKYQGQIDRLEELRKKATSNKQNDRIVREMHEIKRRADKQYGLNLNVLAISH